MRWVFAAAKKRKADRSKEREKKVFSFRFVKKKKTVETDDNVLGIFIKSHRNSQRTAFSGS